MPPILSRISLKAQFAMLFCIFLLPGFALLFWIRAEVRQIESEEIHRSVTQLARLLAETQVSRAHGVEQLIATFAAAPGIRTTEPDACNAFFRELARRSSPDYLNFGLLDMQGRVICAAHNAPGVSLGHRQVFKDAIRTDRLAGQAVVRGLMREQEIFSYMRAIRQGGDAKPTAVAFVGFDLHAVAASLTRVPLPEHALLALVHRDGRLIAAYPTEAAGPMRNVEPQIRALGTADRVFSVDNDDGITRTYAAVPLGAPDDLLAVAALPASGRQDARILTAVLVFGACSLVTLLVAVAVANRGIRRPIERLLDAMARVRQGDLDVRMALADATPEVRTLSQGFDEMTAQLRERELRSRQAQRLEAVGQLAGGIAHDFNNMLTAIIGFGEELRGHVLPPGRDLLEEVLGAGTRAKDLTQQLLAFSRRQVLQADPVQLTQTVHDLSRLLERIIGEHVTLDLKLAPELPLIRADRTQLEQVITNLAVNARDAMPQGGTLTLATDSILVVDGGSVGRPDMPAARYVRLTVTDTGHGMDAETLAHVFEPFFTTKELGKGTGLGLATVYGVVRQSGGYVIVNSTRGGGTTFDVYFPAIEALPEHVPASVQPERQATGAGETILVVEDESSVRRLAVAILRRAGYTVLEAADAPRALEVADTGVPIDLLLTDVVLPGGPSGIGLGRTLKAARPGLVVLHMSGYSIELTSRTTPEERAMFLAKPFTPTAMLAAVHAALGTRSTRVA